MAAITTVALFALISISSCSAETIVDLTTPTESVTDGGILAFECRITNMQDSYKVNILRVRDDLTDEITTGSGYAPESPLGQRAFLAQRAIDGDVIFFLTILDVSMSEEAEYFCRVFSYNRGKYVHIAEDSINIKVFSFPNMFYPICDSEPAQPGAVNQGSTLTLYCRTEVGYPHVQMQWTSNKDIALSAHDTSNDEIVSSKLIFISDKSHNGAYLECTIRSSGFPDRQRSCRIGPIIIIDDDSTEQGNSNGNVIAPVVINNNNNMDTKDASKTGQCVASCSPEDESTMFYLIIFASGATILWIVFLTTTIIACYQYSSVSTAIREGRRSVRDVSAEGDAVYVSLQRRNERNSIMSERNSMYMTLEDPNNPGSKIIMPKDAFDEFYNTLSIRKV